MGARITQSILSLTVSAFDAATETNLILPPLLSVKRIDHTRAIYNISLKTGSESTFNIIAMSCSFPSEATTHTCPLWFSGRYCRMSTAWNIVQREVCQENIFHGMTFGSHSFSLSHRYFRIHAPVWPAACIIKLVWGWKNAYDQQNYSERTM